MRCKPFKIRADRARRARVTHNSIQEPTGRVRAFYDETGGDYDSWLRLYERLMGVGDGRRQLLTRAKGATLEVGVGTRLNLRHYPVDVDLTGIDLSSGMLRIAANRATRLRRAVDLRVGDARSLPFPDATFDTVVATLVLSAVPDHRRTVLEIVRVLKPGGRLLALDHMRSTVAPVGWLQERLEPVLVDYAAWRFTRDSVAEVRLAGLVVEACRRRRLGMLVELVARKPDR
jgi:ubiquinone/menaquinone biosynthesis C-methylase UbiE